MIGTVDRLPYEGEPLGEVAVADRPPEPDWSTTTEEELEFLRATLTA
ncbi:hypothetical protein [Microbispora sp. KK1-11]|nr:hypothetical protein [Microbispora sp. KK1-11]